jgi:hypothetical protein
LFSEVLKSEGNQQIRSSVDTSQGEIYETLNPLDLAISWRGNVYNSNWKEDLNLHAKEILKYLMTDFL